MEQVENSIIGREILEIIGNPKATSKNVKFRLTLHTVNLDIPIITIESIELLKNYNDNIGDYIVATFLMPMGDFMKDVYPYRDNLEITITRLSQDGKDTRRYKFLLLNNLMDKNGTRYTSSTRDELNKLEQARVEGQCVDPIIEALRISPVDGTYNITTVEDLIKGLFIDTLDNKVKINGKPVEYTLTIDPPDNKHLYGHIEIPTGTYLIDLPVYLQETSYGVYNGGLGLYISWLDNRYNIHIYPLYKKIKFDGPKTISKLMVYSIPSVKFDYSEHTYLVDGDIVKIYAGRSTRSIDTGENQLNDMGNGYVYTEPNLLISKNSINTDAGVVTDTNLLNKSIQIKDKKDQSNYIKHIGPINNRYRAKSTVMKATLTTYQIQWLHCDEHLIRPGMAVMFIYKHKDKGVIKLKGIVQSAYFMYNIGTKTTSGILNIMVEKPEMKKP